MVNDPDSNPYGESDASMPAHYDRALGPIFFADFAEDIARRAAAAAPVRVLETAAGTGIVTRRLRDCLPADSLLTATDLNPQMLEFLRGKFAAADNVVSQLADATELPFPDGSFDAVVCQFGVMFFPDKEQAYREAYRVLDVGGRYVFSVWDSHNYNPVGRLMSDIAARFFPADPPRFFDMPFTCHHIDPIKESLITAGFTDLRVSVLRVDKTIPDAASYARGLVHGSPLIDQVRARGGVDPEVMVAAITEALHQRFGADPSQIPLQAIVFEATRPN
jgi:SAM-dependent methyltransferase